MELRFYTHSICYLESRPPAHVYEMVENAYSGKIDSNPSTLFKHRSNITPYLCAYFGAEI